MAASPSPSTSILSSLPEACNDTSSNGGSAGNPVSNDTFDQHTLLSAYVAQKHAQGCKHIDNQTRDFPLCKISKLGCPSTPQI
jgi:hypothetical protein